MGMMEKKMETTIQGLGLRVKGLRFRGIMEKKTETTIVDWAKLPSCQALHGFQA